MTRGWRVPGERGLHGGAFLRAKILARHRFAGALHGGFRSPFVDVFGFQRHVRHHFHRSLIDRHEAFAHCEILLRAAFAGHQLPGLDLREHGNVHGQHTHFPLDRRDYDAVHVIAVSDFLRCDDFEFEGSHEIKS